ncbi:putative acetyltransferase [Streptoalloteichus tenebrarius]|uniref:Acetyltransferase n=1 Tax=Streptoalloteichus tenebrarius (strain ATCC 17920 / DSM 40477 / JCM 4838 / CBS 697.72 / NBRC 16177 / NCIMB 11028 / NRRL B-12390 / A12253. 1 / ISP 5477) TaxID=1933 RepID=A0ABT1HX57_STRSD|nr:GNAT family N-acetyltransferase [Streptoalloteichus tenebrarius]MCP2260107.1 putative acetyltransferase [Streptoalloteichus tenebrarius]BFF00573.1 GNAT family N-acetyltransferase [Streptoalloteichus tenebrarius]
MSESALTVRPLAAHQIEEYIRLDHDAFLVNSTPAAVERDTARVELPRSLGAFDTDGTLLGGAFALTLDMTLPGVGPSPVAGVTGVVVAVDQRRRGVLTALMRAQLRGLHEAGAEPVAALWASEGGIYGRFGYGPAAWRCRVAVPRGAAFRDGVDVGEDRVRDLPEEQAAPLLRELHTKVAATSVGWISRPETAWRWWYADDDAVADGFTRLRFAVHPDGYATYAVRQDWTDRGPRHLLRVREIVAATPVAYAALWRYLLDLDLVGEVEHPFARSDEPLPHLLVDPRLAPRTLHDALWARVVDVDRGLMARRYAAPTDVVMEVTDAFCPWNAGRWRLRIDASGTADVRRTEAEPDLVLDVAALGSAFLGGPTLVELADAGRVREARPGAVATVSRAFAGDRAPHCPESF